MPRKRSPRGFYSLGSRGFIRVKNCELVEAKSSEREKVVVRLITDSARTCAASERLFKRVCKDTNDLASYPFFSFLIVRYSDKFDRFEMKIWKWKSNDDTNVYMTNRKE